MQLYHHNGLRRLAQLSALAALSASSLVNVNAVAVAAAPAAAFSPLSVTFVSSLTGWALGWAPCKVAGACLALRRTTDGAEAWSVEPVPRGLAATADKKAYGQPLLLNAGPGSWLNVRFADPADGWIYGGLPNGGPLLWSTHDGGTFWHQLPVTGLYPDDPVFDLEAAAGTVYLMAMGQDETVTVESSPVGLDASHKDPTPALTLPAGGAQPGGSIVLEARHGWLVEGNDRGVTGSAVLEKDGHWTTWAPPCEAVGDSYAVPAPSNGADLVAVCVMGGFASPLSKSAPPGASLGSSWLYFSTDGGKSFHHGPELLPRRDYFGGVLASPRPGVVVTDRSEGNSEQLIASFDNGRHWEAVYQGYFFYLGFTSPTEGVGLVRLSSGTGRSMMVMTYDGGHHWSKVNF
ncbi:MAG: hypothetical protein ACP5VR_05295 [Acidimicrobiales bacterium]